ncbi:cyclin-J18 isoform X3 [Cajanus cajan]|uniref:cyclin-J18 isoform X3 n=1 Tax=Cajanus cajan TaxID=3821 RepID=UPI0010FAE430|nr:cyclin-J18 isoform X3 [Cajanus cajan]
MRLCRVWVHEMEASEQWHNIRMECWFERLPMVEFLIQCAQHLQVPPIVKYSALSLFADRFFPSLPPYTILNHFPLHVSSSWLIKTSRNNTLRLEISSKQRCFSCSCNYGCTDPKNPYIVAIIEIADSFFKEQNIDTVLDFEIGTTNIAFLFLEDLWVQFKGVAKVGELISIEACMEIMDLLYEKEEMSVLFRSPHSIAAAILVVSYVITVPKQKWEFPVLAWVNFVTSCKEDDMIKMVTVILKHVLEPC